MSTVFDPPPQGDFNRSMIEERLREAMDANGEKVSIELGGERKHLYVISMPIERLYYNPGTRRIRAQRALDPKRDRQLDEAPWSDEGQAYLEKLLKSDQVSLDKVDPDFEALCENLENFGQKDPGIITRSGILVNGNTRCAALNVLGEKYIRVGVLPESTNWDDIHTIELALQLRKEHKREYSYINRLLAIEEQAKLGRRPADIARDFQIKTATLEADRWVYSVLMDVIDRSKTESGASLRLVDFEGQQEKLKELCREYKKVAASDPNAADALKESRLALIAGFRRSKTDVRLAEADFHDKYLAPKLPDEFSIGGHETESVNIPGLDVAVPGDPVDVQRAKSFTDRLLKAKAVIQDGGKAGLSAVNEAKKTLAEVEDAAERALDAAGRDSRLRKRKFAAPVRLSDACDNIDLCIGDLARSRASQGIDEEAFDEQASRLRKSLLKLAREAAKTFVEPGGGTAWLIDIAREEQ